MKNLSLQEKYAPNSVCFGCGPTNTKGLQLKSFDTGEFVICDWMPEKHHEAFPGVLNGGIIGSLLDCHCNWTAAYGLMVTNQQTKILCTVTAEYSIKLLRPTPSHSPVHLKAKVREYDGPDRAWVEGELYSGDRKTATCLGLFVSVKEGHPAFHRWS